MHPSASMRWGACFPGKRLSQPVPEKRHPPPPHFAVACAVLRRRHLTSKAPENLTAYAPLQNPRVRKVCSAAGPGGDGCQDPLRTTGAAFHNFGIFRRAKELGDSRSRGNHTWRYDPPYPARLQSQRRNCALLVKNSRVCAHGSGAGPGIESAREFDGIPLGYGLPCRQNCHHGRRLLMVDNSPSTRPSSRCRLASSACNARSRSAAACAVWSMRCWSAASRRL